MRKINLGVYPTMITPYNKDGSIDLGAVEALTEWYWERGCHGIFAVCMSSEMFALSIEERMALIRAVKLKAERLSAADPNGRTMSVVASGHISDNFDDQIKELVSADEAGADSVVLITNRAFPADCDEESWIEQTERVISGLRKDVSLGFYECPYPQKRLIGDKMLRWIKECGRVDFIKDTCCDIELIKHRLEALKGSSVKLFNANAQTFLPSLKAGAAGFSGIMGNFNPEILVWLFENYKNQPEKAALVQDYICASCAVEGIQYPLGVKYILKEHFGIGSLVKTRMEPEALISDYNKSFVESCFRFNESTHNLLDI